MKKELETRDEEMLLLDLCRLSFSNEQASGIKELVNTVSDWDYFAFLANEHGVAALACYNLEKLGFINLIPEKVISALKNSMMLSLSRNAFHIETISEVLRLLNNKNIKIILLKGLALEIDIYGNTGLRQMTDIDILVDHSHYELAQNILIENGYQPLPLKSVFLKPVIAWRGKHLPTLLKKGSSIDMHLELFGGKNNNLTSLLMENSYGITVNGQKAYIPQPQLFFLYLVRHLYLHEINNESQLRLYTDLVVMLEKYYDQIINHDLLAFASKAGMSQILAWRLEPLRDLWGIRFPDWIDGFIDKWHNSDSIKKFVFFLKSPKNNPSTGNALVFRETIKEIPGLHRKMFFVLGELFPTFTFMKERYKCRNNLTALLYYPHRFGKILWFFMK
jgi:hypothetical protein